MATVEKSEAAAAQCVVSGSRWLEAKRDALRRPEGLTSRDGAQVID